jgi:hypothetical protein
MTRSTNGRAPAPVIDELPDRPDAPADRTALRLRIVELAAATVGQFAQAREEVRTEHIIPLAERLLTWVEQP